MNNINSLLLFYLFFVNKIIIKVYIIFINLNNLNLYIYKFK